MPPCSRESTPFFLPVQLLASVTLSRTCAEMDFGTFLVRSSSGQGPIRRRSSYLLHPLRSSIMASPI